MSTAIATPVATTTLPDGTQVRSDMTPQEIHNAAAKAIGAPPVERPTWNGFAYSGPPVAYRDQQASLPQPLREEGIAQPASSGNRLSGYQAAQLIEQRFANLPRSQREQFKPAYDAALSEIAAGGSVEMYADGSMRTYLPGESLRDSEGKPATTPAHMPDGAIDQKALDKLEEVYRGMSKADQEANRELFEKDLAAILEGRRLNESMAEFRARKAGATVPAAQPEASEGALTGQAALDSLEAEWKALTVEEQAAERDDYLAARKLVEEGGAIRPADEHTPEEWAAGHADVTGADGFIPLERINPQGLSGYQLPRFVPDQTYHASVFADLARARAAGISQETVNAFIRQGMIEQGFNV